MRSTVKSISRIRLETTTIGFLNVFAIISRLFLFEIMEGMDEQGGWKREETSLKDLKKLLSGKIFFFYK